MPAEETVMSLGKRIALARKAQGLGQAKLAEELGVSAEAVSKWEQDKYAPSAEMMTKLEKELMLFAYDEEGEPRNARLFDEEHMSAFIKGRLNAGDYPNTVKALNYAKEKHAGAFRKTVQKVKVPYISHPLTLACHAFAMGLEDDVLLAALLLHDVVEDCGVQPEELPVSQEVQRLVALVSKPKNRSAFSEDMYYEAIEQNPKACLVKCIDRCNNLSLMATGFTAEKIAKYVEETETYYPKLLKVVKDCPAYNDAAWLLSYQIRSLLALAKRVK